MEIDKVLASTENMHGNLFSLDYSKKNLSDIQQCDKNNSNSPLNIIDNIAVTYIECNKTKSNIEFYTRDYNSLYKKIINEKDLKRRIKLIDHCEQLQKDSNKELKDINLDYEKIKEKSNCLFNVFNSLNKEELSSILLGNEIEFARFAFTYIFAGQKECLKPSCLIDKKMAKFIQEHKDELKGIDELDFNSEVLGEGRYLFVGNRKALLKLIRQNRELFCKVKNINNINEIYKYLGENFKWAFSSNNIDTFREHVTVGLILGMPKHHVVKASAYIPYLKGYVDYKKNYLEFLYALNAGKGIPGEVHSKEEYEKYREGIKASLTDEKKIRSSREVRRIMIPYDIPQEIVKLCSEFGIYVLPTKEPYAISCYRFGYDNYLDSMQKIYNKISKDTQYEKNLYKLKDKMNNLGYYEDPFELF